MWSFFFKNWPNLRRAALQIGYDNGMIFRDHDEATFLAEAEARVQRIALYEKTKAVEDYLGGLSEADFQTACVGEHSEAQALLKDNPDVDAYLAAVFE